MVDGEVQIQATLTAAADSEEAENTVRAVRDAVHAHARTADQILVGGNTAIQIDTVDTSARDLRVIIPVILVAVLIVLILLLRSLIAALLLVVATVLSFGAALGVSALVFNHVFDFPGADPAVPLFAFVFLVALGIDYSIFLMTRAREEVAFYGPHDGVMRGLRVTGGVITSAGIVLAATFAALAVIPILFLAQIAFIVAFGVLLDTFVVRTLLVPAAGDRHGLRSPGGRSARSRRGTSSTIAGRRGSTSRRRWGEPGRPASGAAAGKTPCTAMHQVTTRAGDTLSCGRLPPAGAIIRWFIGASALPPKDSPAAAGAGNEPAGDAVVAVDDAPTACRCAGSWAAVSRTDSLPTASPGRPRAQSRTLAGADGRAATQVGQGERGPAVTAVDGPDQREERRVLDDREQLTVARQPAARDEVECERAQLADERFRHGASALPKP